jgi:SWI/SNF-related matrix-associated actin-dependent regulator of chromatin subfamily A-like protein 1
MGLGKTLQYIRAADAVNAKHILVIVPASMKIGCARAFAALQTVKRNIFVAESTTSNIPPHADVIIVNYETLTSTRPGNVYEKLKRRKPFDVVIVDEAHNIKNKDAQRTLRILGKNSPLKTANRIWLATGTPLLNYPVEIFAISSVLATECIRPYESYEAFTDYFCGGGRQNLNGRFVGASNIDELRERLKPFMLRRAKEEVLHELPGKVETTIEIPGGPDVTLDDTPMSTVRRETGLAKIDGAVGFIQETLQQVPKLVIFAHHRDVIFGLCDRLEGASALLGGMGIKEKQNVIDNFINSETSRVIILQTHTGGQGVDGLQGVCNYVVFAETDWSPGVMDQAVDRLHRIGQKNTLFVYYLVLAGENLDVIITGSAIKKRKVINQLLLSDINEKKENYKMTNDRTAAAFELIANSMALIAQAMHHVSGVDTAQLTPPPATSVPNEQQQEAEKPKRTRQTKTANDVPAVAAGSTAPSEKVPEPTTVPSFSFEDVRKAAATFLSDGVTPGMSPGEINNIKDENKHIIKTDVLQNTFGVEDLKSLEPGQYEAFIEALKKGADHYANITGGDDLEGM